MDTRGTVSGPQSRSSTGELLIVDQSLHDVAGQADSPALGDSPGDLFVEQLRESLHLGSAEEPTFAGLRFTHLLQHHLDEKALKLLSRLSDALDIPATGRLLELAGQRRVLLARRLRLGGGHESSGVDLGTHDGKPP